MIERFLKKCLLSNQQPKPQRYSGYDIKLEKAAKPKILGKTTKWMIFLLDILLKQFFIQLLE